MKTKSVVLLLSIVTLLSTGASVALASDSWNYGYTIGTAYSNYLHSSKEHSATVINTNTGRQGKDKAHPAAWAEATVSRGILDKAAFYYNYW